MSVSRRGRRPISDRICDAVILFAAAWTLACHVAVMTGGSLFDVFANFAVVSVFGVGAWLLLRGQSTASEPASTRSQAAGFSEFQGAAWLVRGVAVLAGVAALALYASTGDALQLWWASVGLLSLALLVGLIASPQPEAVEAPSRTLHQEIFLWSMGAACALIVLFFHRPDYDSAFYVSMAVDAADHPAAPLMMDTIHGVAGLAMHMPAHRVHSFEVFVGALSFLTGLPAIFCYHAVVPAVVAFLVPLAFARLFRQLTPRHWHWSVLALLAVLVGAGGTLWWYGNLSIVRLFHGKSVYMSLFLPLAYAHGLRFGAQQNWRRWGLLFCVQIAAVGCSSSALWSVPIATGLALLCSLRWDRHALRTILYGGLASSYVVLVGLTLVGDMQGVAARVASDSAPGADLAFAFERMLGDGGLELFALGCMLLAWVLQRRGPAQRFAVLLPLAILVLVLNPYWSEAVSRSLTGPSYWRAMWSLPLPILMALTLAAPAQLEGDRSLRFIAPAAALLAMVAFVLLVPANTALSRANRVSRGDFAALKVPSKWYNLAGVLARVAPKASMVVAPEKIALWVPSYHDHPYVAASRELYLQRIEAELGTEDADHRLHMSEIVALPERDIELRIRLTDAYQRRREHEDPVGWFREGLHRYRVRAVLIDKRAPLYAPVIETLQEEGFELRWKKYAYRSRPGHYEVWMLRFRKLNAGGQPARVERRP